MSLYNMLFGSNPLSGVLLHIAGVKPGEIARFRDCHIDGDDIVIYTRTGGGNRECFADDGDCSSCYHTANEALAAKSNYKTDYDDEYDSTYAYFVFSPLPEHNETFEELKAIIGENPPESVSEKFKKAIESIKNMNLK